jgi:AraC family transcriptional regulator
MMTTHAARVIRKALFDPDTAPARFMSVAESTGTEDLLLYRVRHDQTIQSAGISEHHLIAVTVGPAVAAECSIGLAALNYVIPPGNVAVIPSDTEWHVAMAGPTEKIVVGIPKDRLAVVAATAMNELPIITPRIRGQDEQLLSILKEMSLYEFPQLNDGGAWHALADELVHYISISYSTTPTPGRGALTSDHVARINLFLEAHLTERLRIDELADVVQQTRSHFPRLFRRTLGMSPHQYVMRLRLLRARALISRGCSLAESAIAAGFSDQSHLTNWLLRVYGTTPGRLSSRR